MVSLIRGNTRDQWGEHPSILCVDDEIELDYSENSSNIEMLIKILSEMFGDSRYSLW